MTQLQSAFQCLDWNRRPAPLQRLLLGVATVLRPVITWVILTYYYQQNYIIIIYHCIGHYCQLLRQPLLHNYYLLLHGSFPQLFHHPFLVHHY